MPGRSTSEPDHIARFEKVRGRVQRPRARQWLSRTKRRVRIECEMPVTQKERDIGAIAGGNFTGIAECQVVIHIALVE